MEKTNLNQVKSIKLETAAAKLIWSVVKNKKQREIFQCVNIKEGGLLEVTDGRRAFRIRSRLSKRFPAELKGVFLVGDRPRLNSKESWVLLNLKGNSRLPFPNFDAVFPKEEEREAVSEIKLNKKDPVQTTRAVIDLYKETGRAIQYPFLVDLADAFNKSIFWEIFSRIKPKEGESTISWPIGVQTTYEGIEVEGLLVTFVY